jgi:hypothetical protein
MAYVNLIQARKPVDAMTRGLGWFSIGLGLLELAAPRRLGGALGLERRSGLLQFYGAREILAGLGILAARRPAAWLWARVAGDALDLATLAPGLREGNRQRGFAAAAAAAVAGITLLDIYCAMQSGEEKPVNRGLLKDYSARSGFPQSPEMMRGAALRTQS